MENSRRNFLIQGAGVVGAGMFGLTAVLAREKDTFAAGRSGAPEDCKPINVCDMGAVGDGRHDDTAAIQRAISVGTMIFIPTTPEGFLISASLQVPSDRELSLEGTLHLASSFPADHSAVEIVGNIANVTVTGSGGIDATNAPRIVTIGGIMVSGTSSTTITTQHVRIRGITIKNTPGSPCNIGGSVKDVVVSGVTFNDVGEPAQIVGLAENCHFYGCSLDGSGDSGFSTWGDVHNSSFEACESSHCFASGIQVYNDGQNPHASRNILIAGNLVHDNQGWGIAVYSAASPPITNYDITITGNHCVRNGLAAGRAGNGGIIIWSGCGERILISANTIHHDGPAAIGILANDSFVTIVGNTVYDEGQGAKASGTSLQIGDDHVLVSGNHFFDDQPDPTTKQHIVINGGPYTALSIADNALSNNVPTITNPNLATQISGNLGFNPQGKLDAPAIPASGASLRNPFATLVRVFISGGSVSEITVAGVKTGSISGDVLLGLGETISVTYSISPTWQWLGL